MSSEGPREIRMKPIGVIRTPFTSRVEAPRQPRAAEGVPGVIELEPGFGFEDAISDLELWQYVWVIAYFEGNESYRSKVLPPRSDVKRGVFSTRSPHRPNPIGISACELVKVEGLNVHVRDVDLLDGTPILDIKPYVPWTDAIPDARSGWLGESKVRGERPKDDGPAYTVEIEPEAERALAFLERNGMPLRDVVRYQLSIGPTPHAYRRIRKTEHGYELGVKEFRADFVIEGTHVRVVRLRSGFKTREIESHPELALHRAVERGELDE